MFNFADLAKKRVSPIIKHFSKTPANNNQLKMQTEKAAEEMKDSDLDDHEVLDSAVVKLLEYAKEKKSLSYEELSDFLPEHITNSDKIEQVLALLEAANVQLIEEDSLTEEDERDNQKTSESSKKKTTGGNEKESSLVDDPIRLYLREIGRERLLTGEQEIELSKKMEESENSVISVLKKSGMVIAEFYQIAQKANIKKDIKELNLSKKENTELISECRRLNQFYKDALRAIQGDLRNYTELKLKLISKDENYLEDKECSNLRKKIMRVIKNTFPTNLFRRQGK